MAKRLSEVNLVMILALALAMVMARRLMMVCLRLEEVGVRAAGQGAVLQMWSMKARREVERVPKRSAEMQVSLAFSKRAREVYLLRFCCSALAKVLRGRLWLAR